MKLEPKTHYLHRFTPPLGGVICEGEGRDHDRGIQFHGRFFEVIL